MYAFLNLQHNYLHLLSSSNSHGPYSTKICTSTYDLFYSICHHPPTPPWANIWPISADTRQCAPHVGNHFPGNTSPRLWQHPVLASPNKRHQQHFLVDNSEIMLAPIKLQIFHQLKVKSPLIYRKVKNFHNGGGSIDNFSC